MIDVLDLHFLDKPELIASYLIRGGDDIVLVESGPGSTLPQLEKNLSRLSVESKDITHILLTHIHLDHAGAAGRLAEHGANVYVHEKGARHLADPSRLWSSATRVYGEDMMTTLWGEMLPVPASQIVVMKDGDTLEAAGQTFTALNTPGHANHHLAYLMDTGDCFTGDVGACALPGRTHIRVPTPPPELDLDAWDISLQRLLDAKPQRLHLTHFGTRDHPQDHLHQTREELHRLTDWMKQQWQQQATREEMLTRYFTMMEAKARQDGATEDDLRQYEMVVGASGCVGGYRRYFRKQQEQENAQ